MNDIKVAINYISSLSSAPDKRGAERGASLALLRNMLDDNSAIIDRHPSGAPFLPGYPDKVISISHSGDYIAISIGNSPQGIDIQIPSPKLNRVASRFISSDDAMPPSCSDPLLLLDHQGSRLQSRPHSRPSPSFNRHSIYPPTVPCRFPVLYAPSGHVRLHRFRS